MVGIMDHNIISESKFNSLGNGVLNCGKTRLTLRDTRLS